MITVIVNGEVYAPEPRGRADVLLLDGKIAKVGEVDRDAAARLVGEVDVVDASGCVVVPGLVDPHEHLLGGSGEEGFDSQTPEITLGEIVAAGITTVVGTLGVDTTMKTMAGLLARAKALAEEGLNAYVWSGGYSVPPTSITSSVRDDVMFVKEVIGAGEIAISDERSMDPTVRDLARIVSDAHVGGMLSRKAGVTHFHVGPGERRLALLRDLLERSAVKPEWLYPTHVGRDEALLEEAIELASRGSYVDLDVVEEDLPARLRFYLDRGGDPRRLTASSDASKTSPANLFEQVRSCVLEHDFALEEVLPIVTSNTARVLALGHKGRLEPGKVGDVVVMRRDSLEIVDVLSRGERMVAGGRLVRKEAFLKDSNRRITLEGSRQ